jgi:hypothetical protein
MESGLPTKHSFDIESVPSSSSGERHKKIVCIFYGC